MTKPKYWLDLFTGKTWEEFLEQGATISGFRERRKNTCKKIKTGDFLVCYLTGIQRFVGLLEIKSDMFWDETPLWKDEVFPCRFKVELVNTLNPFTAVPVKSMRDNLSFFIEAKSPQYWSGFFRGSPNLFKNSDAEVIVNAIKKAESNPVEKEYDEKLYWRKPKTYQSSVGVVTVPEKDEDETPEIEYPKMDMYKSSHDEIQLLLLKLGSDLGLDVWVARNDQNREYNGVKFQDVPKIRKSLPRQFDDATNKTIELIDVLWLQGDAIVAAFEVEHTSAVYSGLLRLSDLISMQPNIKINLFIVAPDERRDKVFNEINRPTFARLKPPLPTICSFIPYSKLKKEIELVGSRIRYMKPQFIEEIAEPCFTED